MLPSPSKRRKIDDSRDADASQTEAQPNQSPSQSQLRPQNEANNTATTEPETQSQTARQPPVRRSPTETANQEKQREQREREKRERQQRQQDEEEGRAFGLRDRKALRPSLTSAGSPANETQAQAQAQSGDSSALRSPPKRTSGIHAFAAPPRRVSRKILPTDITFGSPVRKLPHRAREFDTQDGQLASGPDGGFNEDADGDRDGELNQSPQDGINEPELPPTPTQLGLEDPPDRQGGLMSSSPSTRQGRRARRRTTDFFQPSPLAFDPGGTLGEVEEPSNKGPPLVEEPVSEEVVKKRRLRTELSAELQQLKDDINELEKWTGEPDQSDESAEPDIEAFSRIVQSSTSEDSPDANASRPANQSFSSLLSSLLPFSSRAPPKTSHHTSTSPTNPFALEDTTHATPYLTVFAPIAITAQSTKVSTSTNPDTLTETHEITLSAPPPLPRKLYNIPVTYETNPETHSLLSISIPVTTPTPTDANTKAEHIPETVRQWINSRLSNPLLKLDISGLCWGINRYWEAAASRAQVWSTLERNHASLLPGRSRARMASSIPNDENEKSTTTDLRLSIMSHFERTSMLFSSSSSSSREKSHKPKVLLSCPISLDAWTGEPQLQPAISISSMPRSAADGVQPGATKIEREAKKLFRALLMEEGRGRGGFSNDNNNNDNNKNDNKMGPVVLESGGSDMIVRAIGGVLGVLFGDSG